MKKENTAGKRVCIPMVCVRVNGKCKKEFERRVRRRVIKKELRWDDI